ncbi:MAG: hypothetical protein AAFX89_07190 [Pseudomonadota bacterium]
MAQLIYERQLLLHRTKVHAVAANFRFPPHAAQLTYRLNVYPYCGHVDFDVVVVFINVSDGQICLSQSNDFWGLCNVLSYPDIQIPRFFRRHACLGSDGFPRHANAGARKRPSATNCASDT